MSKFCKACSACTYRTKKPGSHCRDGSHCKREMCEYAHASPAGNEHMAGVRAKACRKGIQCGRGDCWFAHPSKAMKCSAGKVVTLTQSVVSIPVGSKVSIKSEKPTYGWGHAHPWSVGTVSSFSGGTYFVDFPEVKGWRGKDEDLQMSSGLDLSTKNIGTEDPAFDQFGFVRNKHGGRFEFTGNGEMEGHEKEMWEVGFVHGKQKLTPTTPYFEVTINVNRADGVGIGLSEDSFFAGSMVGWACESIGFHSNDGYLFYGIETDNGGKGIPFGPTACVGDTIGCGIIFDSSDKPQTIFFTRNQSTVGRFPLRPKDYGMLFPVVTSASPAVVTVNLSANPPVISMPRLRKTDTPSTIEFSSLEQAFSSAVEGDTIEVGDCGVHLMRDPIVIPSTVSVVGVEAAKRPTISRGLGFVFEIFADTLLKNICVKSVGGDKSKSWSQVGGACGVVLRKGNLTIKECDLLSEKGTAVVVDGESINEPLRRLAIEQCKVGPCGRHGVLLYRCAEIISMKDVEITSVEHCCVALNSGDARLSQCVIKGGQEGVCITSSAEKAEDSSLGTVTVQNCCISDFNQGLHVLTSGRGQSEGTLTLRGCTIERCKVAMTANGLSAKIVRDKTSMKDCVKETEVVNGGQIVSGDVATSSVPSPAVEDSAKAGAEIKSPTSTESVKSSLQVPKVSTEANNFARYCRLLMDVGRDVLVALFKDGYKREEKKKWTESCGQSFLNNKFPDGASQRELGKHSVGNIRAGKCEVWDITLLSSLLLNKPGYIKNKTDAKKAAQTLRFERNSLAHSADFARLSLHEQEFNVKWESVKAALDVLMDQLLPAEKDTHRSKIDEIATENLGQSDLEPLVERVQHIKHIQDLAEDASNKADEALRKIDMVDEALRKIDMVAEELKVNNKRFDPNKLPCDVTLSNQKRYRVIKQVGKGGMGTVYEAKLIDSEYHGRNLALKICQGDHWRAEREADIMKSLKKLNHENIVRFLDDALLDEHSSKMVIIMELIKGESLDCWLEKRYSDGSSALTLLAIQPIVKQLVEGMAAVHAENIAHRDLKPGNLIFDEVTEKLVIVDFGLSKMYNTNSTMTSAKAQLGTLLYMSPEQLNDDISAISFPSDIWSIGVIWHEMLTNYTPFEPSASRIEPGNSASRSQRRNLSLKNQLEMTYEVGKKGPRELKMLLSHPAKLPKAVHDTIAKCLSTNIEERFQKAQDLLNHLTGVFEELQNQEHDEVPKEAQKVPWFYARGAVGPTDGTEVEEETPLAPVCASGRSMSLPLHLSLVPKGEVCGSRVQGYNCSLNHEESETNRLKAGAELHPVPHPESAATEIQRVEQPIRHEPEIEMMRREAEEDKEIQRVEAEKGKEMQRLKQEAEINTVKPPSEAPGEEKLYETSDELQYSSSRAKEIAAVQEDPVMTALKEELEEQKKKTAQNAELLLQVQASRLRLLEAKNAEIPRQTMQGHQTAGVSSCCSVS